mmetsp:Transcript_35701/g.64742  ORF Transcript_35701/g.64742 Transcript_35701/m.64742 type:complete len:208 (-) Transcript_35701:3879-4502(-)
MSSTTLLTATSLRTLEVTSAGCGQHRTSVARRRNVKWSSSLSSLALPKRLQSSRQHSIMQRRRMQRCWILVQRLLVAVQSQRLRSPRVNPQALLSRTHSHQMAQPLNRKLRIHLPACPSSAQRRHPQVVGSSALQQSPQLPLEDFFQAVFSELRQLRAGPRSASQTSRVQALGVFLAVALAAVFLGQQKRQKPHKMEKKTSMSRKKS